MCWRRTATGLVAGVSWSLVNARTEARVLAQHGHINVGRAADHELDLAVREERQQAGGEHRVDALEHRLGLQPLALPRQYSIAVL